MDDYKLFNLLNQWNNINNKAKLMLGIFVLAKYSTQIIALFSVLYYLFKYSWVFVFLYAYIKLQKGRQNNQKEK